MSTNQPTTTGPEATPAQERIAQDAERATHPALAADAAQENLAAAQAEVIERTDTPTPTDAPAPEGEPTPVYATWNQHGRPTKGWTYLGAAKAEPDTNAKAKITKAELVDGKIVLSKRGGPAAEPFAPATRFWAIVPADAPRAEVTKPASTGTGGRTPTERPYQGKPSPKAGYVVRWSGAPIAPATDYLKAEAKDADPQWLVRCNLHNTTAAAKSVEDCKKVGTKAARITWCAKCKAEDAAK